MSIDRKTGGASPPEREWCVCVAASVMEHVPRDVLAAWMAVESYANPKGVCWPDNRALAKRMGVSSVASVQRALLKLQEYGILNRHERGGNRRTLTLLRRTRSPITAAEWAVLSERGESRQEERVHPMNFLDRAPL